MTAQTSREVIDEALRAGDKGLPVEMQPSILFNKNIDLTKATSVASCYVNQSHRDVLDVMIGQGWTIFRIQTELGITGHYTMAYLAKMPAN